MLCYVSRYSTIIYIICKGWILLQQVSNYDLRSKYACRNRIYGFSFLWILSVLFGMLFASNEQGTASSLICCALLQDASLIGFLLTAFLPLLIAVVSIFLQIVSPLYIICFIKGISLGYCMISFLAAFGSAGWLLAVLILFSNISSLILFHYLSLLHLSSSRAISLEDFLIAFILFLGIGIVDYIAISPYTAFLISTL